MTATIDPFAPAVEARRDVRTRRSSAPSKDQRHPHALRLAPDDRLHVQPPDGCSSRANLARTAGGPVQQLRAELVDQRTNRDASATDGGPTDRRGNRAAFD